MKKRLHGKKAGIVILVILFVIALAEIVLRGVFLKEAIFEVFNASEPFITALFSLILIFFGVKGKDRIFYILCGGWLFYFVINQIYSLPNMIETLIYSIDTDNTFGGIYTVIHIFTIATIVAIGALLVEYMNDGTICNKAFNVLCILTVVPLACIILLALCAVIVSGEYHVSFVVLYEFSRLMRVFLFTFFAYDSAKLQLKKENLAK